MRTFFLTVSRRTHHLLRVPYGIFIHCWPSVPIYNVEECDHIIDISKRHMSRSGVVASAGGSSISDIRTSSGVFLDRGQDDVVKAIEERIAKWTLMPVGYGEGLQVLKYDPSQKVWP